MHYLVFAGTSGPLRPIFHTTDWSAAAAIQGQVHYDRTLNTTAWLCELESEDLDYFHIDPAQQGWVDSTFNTKETAWHEQQE